MPYDTAILFAACRALGTNYCNLAFAIRKNGPLAKLEQVISGSKDLTAVEDLRRLLFLIKPECRKLGMHVSEDAVDTCILMAKSDSLVQLAMSSLEVIFSSIYTELKLRRFIYVPPELVVFLDCIENEFISESAQMAFPSIIDDYAEACRCYGFARATACVFHCMRCLEIVCHAVALSLDQNMPVKNGWGDYARHADECITKFQASKANAPAHWPASKPFFDEVLADLKSMYKAWRNPTMHIEKVYTTERARDILRSTGALIDHVSTHLDEKGTYRA